MTCVLVLNFPAGQIVIKRSIEKLAHLTKMTHLVQNDHLVRNDHLVQTDPFGSHCQIWSTLKILKMG